MTNSLIEGLQQKHAEREAKKRAEDFTNAVKYSMKKFNCVIVPVVTIVGGYIKSEWIGQALPVEDKK